MQITFLSEVVCCYPLSDWISNILFVSYQKRRESKRHTAMFTSMKTTIYSNPIPVKMRYPLSRCPKCTIDEQIKKEEP